MSGIALLEINPDGGTVLVLRAGQGKWNPALGLIEAEVDSDLRLHRDLD